MTATTERERLEQIHALLTSLDLNGPTTREGTAWGSILRESIELAAAQPVQQPNRDAVIQAIAARLSWPSLHWDWSSPEAHAAITDAVLAALAVPATGEVEPPPFCDRCHLTHSTHECDSSEPCPVCGGNDTDEVTP